MTCATYQTYDPIRDLFSVKLMVLAHFPAYLEIWNHKFDKKYVDIVATLLTIFITSN